MAMSDATGKTGFGGLTALLLSDTSFGSEMMATMLTGIDVRQKYRCNATDGPQKILEGLHVDLVMVDWVKQPALGPAFARDIRFNRECKNCHVPFIMFSAQVNQAEIALARDSGVSAVLAKPYSVATLLKWIERLSNDNRPFITSANYCGPCRRQKAGGVLEGLVDRRAGAQRKLTLRERGLY